MKNYPSIAAFETALRTKDCVVSLVIAFVAGNAYFIGSVNGTSDQIIQVTTP